jgi:hypothetical protein
MIYATPEVLYLLDRVILPHVRTGIFNLKVQRARQEFRKTVRSSRRCTLDPVSPVTRVTRHAA